MTPTFRKIDQKTCKEIISALHFTTYVIFFPKLDTLRVEIIFKSVKGVIQHFCFPYRFIKSGNILDF